jgi:hypothetical protein
VTGLKNAQALALVDVAKTAECLWLAYSSSHVALIDIGLTIADPEESAPPKILWQAVKPHCPQISPGIDRFTWPDGSIFETVIDSSERLFLERNPQG